jgi:hypothetical protein
VSHSVEQKFSGNSVTLSSRSFLASVLLRLAEVFWQQCYSSPVVKKKVFLEKYFVHALIVVLPVLVVVCRLLLYLLVLLDSFYLSSVHSHCRPMCVVLSNVFFFLDSFLPIFVLLFPLVSFNSVICAPDDVSPISCAAIIFLEITPPTFQNSSNNTGDNEK